MPEKASLERCDSSAEPALVFRTLKATRLSVANYNTTVSSESLETGTGSSNSLRSAIESFSVYDSARHDRNTHPHGRFRIACGSGERSEQTLSTTVRDPRTLFAAEKIAGDNAGSGHSEEIVGKWSKILQIAPAS
jgi:hypothetical protein